MGCHFGSFEINIRCLLLAFFAFDRVWRRLVPFAGVRYLNDLVQCCIFSIFGPRVFPRGIFTTFTCTLRSRKIVFSFLEPRANRGKSNNILCHCNDSNSRAIASLRIPTHSLRIEVVNELTNRFSDEISWILGRLVQVA